MNIAIGVIGIWAARIQAVKHFSGANNLANKARGIGCLLGVPNLTDSLTGTIGFFISPLYRFEYGFSHFAAFLNRLFQPAWERGLFVDIEQSKDKDTA